MKESGIELSLVWQYRIYFALLLYLAVAVESVVRFVRQGRALSTAKVAVNVSMWGVELFVRGTTFWMRYALGALLATVALAHLPWTISTSLLCYLLVDFIYYFRHRFWHSTKLGWAVHSTHHTSEEMNVLAAIRLSWIESIFDYLFYLPLVLIGFDPLQVFLMVELNLIAQFWCHTDTIGPLPWLDPWLNTPSNHRMHHARARTVAECNYGSTLMLWDKLFGTYRRGEEGIEYGIEDGRDSLNPFTLQFGHLWRLLAPKPK
jgi:sterol desaturase/sphingolipid hydroxylase (fatty acid hydroxylase superfamily)